MPDAPADLDRLTQDIRALLPPEGHPGVGARLTPALLAALVAVGTPEGRWSLADALAHLRRMPDEEQRAASIQALARRDLPHDIPALLDISRHLQQAQHRTTALIAIAACQSAEAAQPTWEAAFRTARQIEDGETQASALIAIVPHLRPELLCEALEAAYQIENEHGGYYPEAIAVVIAHLPIEQQSQAWEEAFSQVQKRNEQWTVNTAIDFSVMLSYLPADQIDTIIDRAIDLILGEEAVAQAEPYLPMERVRQIFTLAQMLEQGWPCTMMLAQMLPQLSKADRASSYALAQQIGDIEIRNDAIQTILPYLEGDQQNAAWIELLDGTLGQNDGFAFARCLGVVAALPSALVTEALEATLGMSSNTDRTEALRTLIPQLTESQREEVFAYVIEDNSRREEMFEELIPYLHNEHIGTIFKLMQQTDNPIPPDVILLLAANHMDVALELVGTLSNLYERNAAIKSITPYLGEQHIHTALDLVRAITPTDRWGWKNRGETLSIIIRHLPTAQQTLLWYEVLAAIRENPSETLAYTLRYMRSEHVPTILKIIEEISDHRVIGTMIHSIIPYLPPEHLDHVRDLVKKIEGDAYHAHTLAHLSPRLPDKQRAEVLDEALSIVYGMRNDIWRIRSLSSIVRFFPAAQQTNILREAVHFALNTPNMMVLKDALESLAHHLDKALMDETLDAIAIMEDEERRTEALFITARHLYIGQHDKAMAMVKAIEDPLGRGRVLTVLAPHLTTAQLDMALDEAQKIAIPSMQLWILETTIPYLNNGQQPKALEIIHHIEDDYSRILALLHFMRRLPVEQQAALMREALHIALNMQHRKEQMFTFHELFFNFSQPLVDEALELIDTLPDEEQRRSLRHILLSHRADRQPAAPAPTDALAQALGALMPRMQAFTAPEDVAAIARAIEDVAQRWA